MKTDTSFIATFELPIIHETHLFSTNEETENLRKGLDLFDCRSESAYSEHTGDMLINRIARSKLIA